MATHLGPCLCGDPYCPSCGNPEAMREMDRQVQADESLQEENAKLREWVTSMRGMIECAQISNWSDNELALLESVDDFGLAPWQQKKE